MKEKLAKLIDVKTIVTIMLASVFCYLAIIKVISGSEFAVTFTMVIMFYFNKDKKKEVE